MPSVERTFQTTTAPERVFDYLADFANAEQWDPGTVECTRTSGDGGVGTTYRNVSQFMRRRTELTYTAEDLDRATLVHFVGRNDSFTGHDRIALRPSGTGTEVTYRADFAFRGLSRIASPAVALYLPRLADETVDRLRGVLDGLT